MTQDLFNRRTLPSFPSPEFPTGRETPQQDGFVPALSDAASYSVSGLESGDRKSFSPEHSDSRHHQDNVQSLARYSRCVWLLAARSVAASRFMRILMVVAGVCIFLALLSLGFR